MPRNLLTICAVAMCTWPCLSPADQQQAADRPVVAVADFRSVGRVGTGDSGKAVAELLRAALDSRCFRLVERSDLAAILDERDLVTGQVVTAGASEADKLDGVRYVIVGAVVNIGKYCIVARMVDVSSGEVVRTAQASATDIDGLQAAVAQVAWALGTSSAKPQAGSVTTVTDIASAADSTSADAGEPSKQLSTLPAWEEGGLELPVRLRCLWAEIRMLQRCLGVAELMGVPETGNGRRELQLLLAELEAEKAGLIMRIRAGQAIVVTTPVRRTKPPQPPVRVPRIIQKRVSTVRHTRYRRPVGQRISVRPLGRLAFADRRRRRATIQRPPQTRRGVRSRLSAGRGRR